MTEFLKNLTVASVLPAVAMLVVGMLAIRVILKLVDKSMAKSKLEKAAVSLIRSLLRVVLWVLLGLMVASKLGIDVTGVVALASVASLALSLSLQDALSNVIGGFMLLSNHPFHSGDYVEIAGQGGTVQTIDITYTKLTTGDNKTISIPNSAVVSSQIVNYSTSGTRRVDINVSASYDAPIATVTAALLEAAKLDTVLEAPAAPFAAVVSYGDSAINYTLRVWTPADEYWNTMFTINENIKTEPVQTYAISDSDEADGIVIRDEEVLFSSKQFLSIQAEDGKEISKGALLAISTDSEKDLEETNHLAELSREISRLETFLSSSASVVDASSREDNVASSARKLASAVATQDYEATDTAALDLSSLLFMQDASDKAEAKLNKLKAEQESYSNDSRDDDAMIEAPSAGIFTRTTDGFESTSSSEVTSISVSGLKDLMHQSSEPEEGAYGKIIRSFTWHFLALVNSDTAQRLSDGASVSLSFPRYYSGLIPATVLSISKEDGGNCAVVFSTKYALSETMAMRHATAEIIFSQSNGLKVPVSAMHVDDDGNSFVYCLTAKTVERKQVEILTSNKEYYLVKQDTSSSALHEGDTLITAGKNLFDGKVLDGQN